MIGWLARRVAKRMIKDQTLFATSSDSAAMAEIFGTVPTASGVAVTPENAMQVSAVYACTRLLAGAVSSLPLETYRRSVDGRREEVLNDPLWWLLNEQPNPRWTSASMWEWVVASVLLRRDGYAWIRRNANGGIVQSASTGIFRVRSGAILGGATWSILGGRLERALLNNKVDHF